VLVVICVGAALGRQQLTEILHAGGPISAFSEGYGLMSAPLLGVYGKAFAVMALNAFILTTLDTATRIGRYLTAEIFGMTNMSAATGTVVAAGAALALTGQWKYLWPAFGTSNQLIAALALLVGSCWLVHRGRAFMYTFVPACIMLATTLAAFLYQLYGAVTRVDKDGASDPDLFIATVVTVLIVLALTVFWEGVRNLRGGPRSEETAAVRSA
jgi:carbon starvation protein